MFTPILIGLVVGMVAGPLSARAMRRHWPQTGKWGINPQPVACPKCGQTAPRFRRPTSRRQWLWGGWTCSRCGCEMDKYGQQVLD